MVLSDGGCGARVVRVVEEVPRCLTLESLKPPNIIPIPSCGRSLR